MLFSTALPTLIHMLLALASFHRLVPLLLRQWVAGWTHVNHENELRVQFSSMLVIGTYVALTGAMALLFVWGVGKLLWHWGLGAFLYAYQSALVELLVWLSSYRAALPT